MSFGRVRSDLRSATGGQEVHHQADRALESRSWWDLVQDGRRGSILKYWKINHERWWDIIINTGECQDDNANNALTSVMKMSRCARQVTRYLLLNSINSND